MNIPTGNHTLTITASDAEGPCAPTFPQAARRRVYSAAVQERFVSGEHRLEVVLSGANFVTISTTRNSFSGIVSPSGEIKFTIRDAWPGDVWWPWPSPADVVERLTDGTALTLVGDISARRTDGAISGKGGVLAHSSGGECAIESFEMVRN